MKKTTISYVELDDICCWDAAQLIEDDADAVSAFVSVGRAKDILLRHVKTCDPGKAAILREALARLSVLADDDFLAYDPN